MITWVELITQYNQDAILYPLSPAHQTSTASAPFLLYTPPCLCPLQQIWQEEWRVHTGLTATTVQSKREGRQSSTVEICLQPAGTRSLSLIFYLWFGSLVSCNFCCVILNDDLYRISPLSSHSQNRSTLPRLNISFLQFKASHHLVPPSVLTSCFYSRISTFQGKFSTTG